ncbi:hypothetical protein AGMMS50267_04480 [Spirochaetia bacterium]|nr:hypothetical protein AGMMS50267_04480 [Spirochaetia bacterium]
MKKQICIFIFFIMAISTTFSFSQTSVSTMGVNVRIVSDVTTANGYTFTYDSQSTGTIYFYMNITYKDDTKKAFKHVENVIAPGKSSFSIIDERAYASSRLEMEINSRNLELSEVFVSLPSSTVVHDINYALKKYSPSSIYILNSISNASDAGREEQIKLYYHPSINDKLELFSTLATAVHESTHVFWREETFLLDNEKIILPRASRNLWPKTEYVTSQIAENMRSRRWITYVSPGATTSANPNGIYGLLDEFQAYYYGLKAVYDCYPYLQEYGAYEDTIIAYWYIIHLYGDLLQSYYEFKWWILLYMENIKNNYPQLYKQFIESREFLTVFLYFNDHFENLVEVLIPDRVNILVTEMNRLGKETFSIMNDSKGELYLYRQIVVGSITYVNKINLRDKVILSIIDELKKDKYTGMIIEFRKKQEKISKRRR